MQQVFDWIPPKFQFVLTSALLKKPTISTAAEQTDKKPETQDQRRDGSDIGTVGFEIGDVGTTHFLAANKFCFARPHLMLLTSNGHQRQYEPLNELDIAATWNILNAIETDYVAFYNCGKDGGCSRLHKHMQLMPKPENSFANFLENESVKEPNVPFQWFYQRLDSNQVSSNSVYLIYQGLLEQATKASEDRRQDASNVPKDAACPHNMILTKNWIVILPRRRGAINKEAGVNALGMLGVIAVATQNEIDNWAKLGLTDGLRELGFPK